MSCRIGPTLRSLMLCPGSSAFVESDSKRWTPRPASSANPWRSVANPSIGVGSSLKSPVCSTVPEGCRSRPPARRGSSGHVEEPHREPVDLERAAWLGDDPVGERGHAVLLELALQELEREGRTDHRHRPAEVLQQVRERADVILVPVGEHHRGHGVGTVAHELHVGQDQIDAGHVGRRERQTHVEDQQAAVDLEAGHVPADLPDATEEDEPAGGVRQGDRHPRARPGPGRTPAPWRSPAAGGSARRCDPACRAPLSPGSGWT